MTEKNEHVQKLMKALDREIERRREVTKVLAEKYERGQTEKMRGDFIQIQATIDAIRRAIEDEKYSGIANRTVV